MEVKFCERALLMKNHEIFRFYRMCQIYQINLKSPSKIEIWKCKSKLVRKQISVFSHSILYAVSHTLFQICLPLVIYIFYQIVKLSPNQVLMKVVGQILLAPITTVILSLFLIFSRKKDKNLQSTIWREFIHVQNH